jgi:hypothetical protein
MSGMFEVSFYLRCEKDHANNVGLGGRDSRIGTPCFTCGKPLLAPPAREPFARRF